MRGVILIIEDSPTVRGLAEYQLQTAGYSTVTAGDGETGIGAARRHMPDLVLCDIQLPTMNGYEVMYVFAHDPALARIPVLAFTAQDEADDAGAISAAGFHGRAPKPLTLKFIENELGAYLALPS